MKQFSGIAAARGITFGPIFQFRQDDLRVDSRRVDSTDEEISRFEKALQTTMLHLQAVHEKASTELTEEQAAIFEAHLMMLQDPELQETVRSYITKKKASAEFAVKEATEHYAKILEGMESEYFSARAADVRDVARSLMRELMGVEGTDISELVQPSIIIANDLTPSDTILFDKRLVLGFCTVEGSQTSHTAILARGLGIPAVVGCSAEIIQIPNSGEAILDGSAGKFIVAPNRQVIETYRGKQSSFADLAEKSKLLCHDPAVTLDGHHVEVVANIGNLEGARSALENGAEGIGLLRSEFLYMERETLPDEEEQFTAYSEILANFGNQPVVLRTSDIGGDKELPYLDLQKETNPFLGVRGVRLGLAHERDLLKPQLRASIRAGRGHDLRVMFPMVASITEIRQARKIFNECRDELIAEGKPVAEKIQVGIMVEVPSAAVMADILAPEVDFFSIGTNDLTQYTLAVDRTNPQLAYLTSAFSPAVLRLIQNVILQAHRFGKWVGLCGELAGESMAIPILFGLGLDEFSMNPPAIPVAKQIIRNLELPKCQKMAEDVLALESADEVVKYMQEHMPQFSE
jgi:phosphotransferase system enzyme I (PtsI)